MALQYIVAGDSGQFTFASSDYPATAWTLNYLLAGPSNLTIAGVATGSNFLVSLTAAQSTVLLPGMYSWAVRVYQGVKAYTVDSGVVEVKPNPLQLTPKILMAQQMIDLIDKALLNQLTEGEAMEALSIGGRSISNISRLELLQERSTWYAELQRYKNAVGGKSALGTIGIYASGI